MNEKTIQVYRYRWIVLTVFMFVTAMNQGLWISFAPIASLAADFYSTSELMIGLLSMSFMVVYILLVVPSAWAIDTWGFRIAVNIGAVLTAVFSLSRGMFAASFPLVFASQLGIALGQPLILGSITKLAARWFPPEERATASGLGTLSIYLGILISMIITPILTARFEIQGMLWIGGLAASLSAIAFMLLAREHPPTPPDLQAAEERAILFIGLKNMLRQKDFILLLVVMFIGLGAFNGISTWIEVIVQPRGFDISQAGILGGLMLLGGIVGAVAIPILSDKLRRRKPFIILACFGLVPGLLGIAFADSYWLLLLSGFWFGFFLLSAGPIVIQYGAEITHPAPEGTSNSLLLVAGQISGILFIFGMELFKSENGSMTYSLLALVGLAALLGLISFLLQESPIQNSG